MPDGEYVHAGVARNGHLRLHDLDPGVPVEVIVVPRSKRGEKGDPESGVRAMVAPLGDRAQPPDVQNFSGAAIRDSVILQWSAVEDRRVKGYQIRSGARWTGGRIIADCVQGTVWTSPLWWYGSERFMVKAITRSGIQSDLEAVFSVTTNAADFLVRETSQQDPSWSGAFAGMSISGTYLGGTSIAGSYTSTPIVAAAGTTRYRLLLSIDTDIAGVPLTLDKCGFRLDSAYSLRHTLDQLAGDAWEGTENNDLRTLSDQRFAFDSLYAVCGDLRGPFDFPASVAWTVEVRYSVDGGTSWGAWARFVPSVQTCNAAQARVSYVAPSALLSPRIRSMTLRLVDGNVVLSDRPIGAGFDGDVNPIVDNTAIEVIVDYSFHVEALRIAAEPAGNATVWIRWRTFDEEYDGAGFVPIHPIPPALSGSGSLEDLTLSGWTRDFAGPGVMQFEVTGVATIRRLNASLTISRR